MRKKYANKKIALTMGDPCGVGPEIIAKAADCLADKTDLVVAGDPSVMERAAALFGGKRGLWSSVKKITRIEQAREPGHKLFISSNLSIGELTPGRPGKEHGKAAWDYMEAGLELVKEGICKALVTAPVTKSALRSAGFPFSGHTDWLAHRTGQRAVMMLVKGRLRVVPVTMHLPLASVPASLSVELVLETVTQVHESLKRMFGIKRPRIAVAGLNPHAGEEGMLGSEEQEIIGPAIEKAVSAGMQVTGPHPADTMFTPEAKKTYDAAVCMYHDQAMIPVKSLGFKKAVNITLGPPFVRTSPAHGAAADIAWKGRADHRSMTAAIKLAVRLAGLPTRSPSA